MDNIYYNLLKMPKVELHLHLDGSINIDLASKLLSDDYNTVKKKLQINGKVNSLSEYLTKFDLPIELMQTKDRLFLFTKRLIEDLIKENVIYAEIRFAPILHTKEGLKQEQVLKSVIEGLKSEHIKTNLILCLMRGFDYESNLETINIAKKYLDNGVCAIDLAGDEAKYQNELYNELFNYANKLEIPYTLHAGEADGPLSIKSAIDIGAIRIGHGVNLYKDANLLKEVIDKQICLEVCPTSNINTNIFSSIKEHPIYEYYKNGVNVTINTDNRTVSNITLTNEYYNLINNFDIKIEDLINMNINAIKSSFAINEIKSNILNRLEEFKEDYENDHD